MCLEAACDMYHVLFLKPPQYSTLLWYSFSATSLLFSTHFFPSSVPPFFTFSLSLHLISLSFLSLLCFLLFCYFTLSCPLSFSIYLLSSQSSLLFSLTFRWFHHLSPSASFPPVVSSLHLISFFQLLDTSATSILPHLARVPSMAAWIVRVRNQGNDSRISQRGHSNFAVWLSHHPQAISQKFPSNLSSSRRHFLLVPNIFFPPDSSPQTKSESHPRRSLICSHKDLVIASFPFAIHPSYPTLTQLPLTSSPLPLQTTLLKNSSLASPCSSPRSPLSSSPTFTRLTTDLKNSFTHHYSHHSLIPLRLLRHI